jgi:hypothetical protein
VYCRYQSCLVPADIEHSQFANLISRRKYRSKFSKRIEVALLHQVIPLCKSVSYLRILVCKVIKPLASAYQMVQVVLRAGKPSDVSHQRGRERRCGTMRNVLRGLRCMRLLDPIATQVTQPEFVEIGIAFCALH